MSDKYDDMRRAMELGIPFTSACMTFPSADCFGPDWHLQAALDHYFLPTFKVVGAPVTASTNWNLALMSQFAARGLPICIKDDNRAAPMTDAKYRVPLAGLTEAGIDPSSVVMRLSADGLSIEDDGLADVLGPMTAWEAEAKARATGAYLKLLQAACPTPAWVTDNDNNETFVTKTPWGTEQKPTRIKVGIVNGAMVFKWADRDAVRRINLRIDRWIMANGGYATDPDLFYKTFRDMHNGHYAAYDKAFANASPAGWQNRYTEGYSAWRPDGFAAQKFVYDAIGPGLHQPTAYSATGPSVYLNKSDTLFSLRPSTTTPDIDQTVWNYTRSKNPRAYRTMWISCDGGGALNAALNGIHDVVDPAMWQAWSAFVAWRSRATYGGAAFNLRYWDGWNTRRDFKMFGDPNEVPGKFESATQKAQREARVAIAVQRWGQLDQLGRPELKICTVEDYVRAMMAGVTDINLRSQKFYCEGETIQLAPQTNLKYRYVAVQRGTEILLYVFTPCKLAGPVRISIPRAGDFDITLDGYGTYRKLIPRSGFDVVPL